MTDTSHLWYPVKPPLLPNNTLRTTVTWGTFPVIFSHHLSGPRTSVKARLLCCLYLDRTVMAFLFWTEVDLFTTFYTHTQTEHKLIILSAQPSSSTLSSAATPLFMQTTPPPFPSIMPTLKSNLRVGTGTPFLIMPSPLSRRPWSVDTWRCNDHHCGLQEARWLIVHIFDIQWSLHCFSYILMTSPWSICMYAFDSHKTAAAWGTFSVISSPLLWASDFNRFFSSQNVILFLPWLDSDGLLHCQH